MKSTRETIEDALIEQISSALLQSRNPRSGYLALVGTYNGELEQDDISLEDFRRRLGGAFPAVLVSAGASPFTNESVARRRFRRDIVVELYAASNNLRSREQRVRVDPSFEANETRDLGIYTLLEHLHKIVAGNDLGLDGVSPASPIREEPLLQLDEFTVWRSIFEFKTDAHVEPWSAGDGQSLTTYFLKSQIAEEPPDVSPNPIVESEGTIPE